MKRTLSIVSTLGAVVLLIGCATTDGTAKPGDELPICKPDYSNQPCRIPTDPPRCPPGSPDPWDPFCRQMPPVPPIPLPPHR